MNGVSTRHYKHVIPEMVESVGISKSSVSRETIEVSGSALQELRGRRLEDTDFLTNADEGIRQYYRRYGSAYIALMKDLGPTPAFDEAMIEAVAAGVDQMTGSESTAHQQHRRDQLILRIRQLKRETSPGV